jgi:putative heme-binding domain-containing protein
LAVVLVCLAQLPSSVAFPDDRRTGASSESPPRWIWTEHDRPAGVRFSQHLRIEAAIQSAELRFAADFCRATVELNDRPVLRVEPYVQVQTLDVTRWLQRGENRFAIRAERVPGPPAVALSLDVICTDGSRGRLITNADWQATTLDVENAASNAAADLGNLPPEHWGVGRRGIDLSPFENYEQWQQAKSDSPKRRPSQFWTAPGFEIAELRVAEPDEGSWVSLAFDPQGRLTIAREDAGFLRMTLSDDAARVTRVEPIASTLEECRGLAYFDDWLYANANNSRGLYRLRTGDDGVVRDLQRLREFPGNVGHGRNDIALVDRAGSSPQLYAIHGDAVQLPGPPIVDHTSPLNESRRRTPQREGYLLRTDLEGRQWELLCAGLRNPYGIAVHACGDPFTFDADNEYDMGTPWYRPTRILHLMTGGDSGYRDVTGRFPPRFHDHPDHAPPLLDIGRSSPTSVMFGDQLNFASPYRQALFALDWTYGRVLAIHLAMRGGTWRAAPELFLQGRPLNVTDVAAGPDGAMYLITGGRKTQSALYRIRYTGGDAKSEPSRGKHEQDAHRHSLTIRSSPPTSDLNDADPVRRHAARIALERRPLSEWRSAALDAESGPAALRTLLALARARQTEDAPPIVDRLLEYRVDRLDLASQFVWIRLCGLCRETTVDVVQSRSAALAPKLRELWSARNQTDCLSVAPEGTSQELRRRVALLLGELSAPQLPEQIVPSLLASRMQEDQIAGLMALRSIRDGWTIALRRQQFQALNAMPQMIGGQGLPAVEKWLRTETLATLTSQEKAALADVLQPSPPLSEPLPARRSHVQKWTLADLAALYDAEAIPGDAARGRLVFRDALCNRCHRVGLRGAAVGPELTQLSRRFSRRDILESVLTPSLSVAENYRLETIVTEAGKSYTGRIVPEGDYRSETIKLATDPLRPDQIVEIDKKQIADHHVTSLSPMPQGLLDGFSLAEIRDLLAYLEFGLGD